MPDLNTVPASPHGLAGSRRGSTNVPANAENILPSNQSVVHPQTDATAASSSLPSPQLPAAQPTTADAGPGPLRHPRPLTASELHMQLEKEQEAVVNRLTRELSLLRAAHNASVASNASSTSASNSTHDPAADGSLLSGTAFTIPSGRRHNRTPSTASQSQLGTSYESRVGRLEAAAHRSSQAHVPPSIDPSSYFHQQRVPQSASSVVATPSVGDQLSPGLMPATLRYEETAHYRSELETAKRENEALKRRIRELELMVRSKSRDNSRARSDSVSTTASASVATGGGSSIAGPRDQSVRGDRGRNLARQSIASVGVGVPDEELNVGESAASAGLKREE